jgi:predicted GNAT family N-acyltransferase
MSSSHQQKSQKGNYHFRAKVPEEKDGEPPMCRVCQHPHVGKCGICGHVLHAKSNVFSASGCPAKGSPTTSALHFKLFSPSNTEIFESGWSLAKIIRRKVFVEEYQGQTFPGEVCEQLWATEVQQDDGTCQHSIGYYGDMPVATARWKIIAKNDGQRLIKLDRVCVLQRYRRRHVFMDLMSHAISEAVATAETLNVTAMLFCCPTNLPFLTPALASLQFQGYPEQQFTEDGITAPKVPFIRRLR